MHCWIRTGALKFVPIFGVMLFNLNSFLYKNCPFPTGSRHYTEDVRVCITECGTCLVTPKHPSYTSSVFLHRQPKKQDVNAWRNACSPSQTRAPGIRTRGKRAFFFFFRQFLFFSFLLSFSSLPPPGNGLIITPRPELVSLGATRSGWGAWW